MNSSLKEGEPAANLCEQLEPMVHMLFHVVSCWDKLCERQSQPNICSPLPSAPCPHGSALPSTRLSSHQIYRCRGQSTRLTIGKPCHLRYTKRQNSCSTKAQAWAPGISAANQLLSINFSCPEVCANGSKIFWDGAIRHFSHNEESNAADAGNSGPDNRVAMTTNESTWQTLLLSAGVLRHTTRSFVVWHTPQSINPYLKRVCTSNESNVTRNSFPQPNFCREYRITHHQLINLLFRSFEVEGPVDFAKGPVSPQSPPSPPSIWAYLPLLGCVHEVHINSPSSRASSQGSNSGRKMLQLHLAEI